VSRLPKQTVITDDSPEINNNKKKTNAEIAPAPVHAITKTKDTMHVVDVQ